MSWPSKVLTAFAVPAVWLAVVAAPARAVPATPADRFVDSVGVNTHLFYVDTPYWDLPKTRDALAYLGVRHVRDGIQYWAPGRKDWYMAAQTERFTALARDGIKINALFGGPRNEAGTNAQLLDTAARFKNIATVEGTNEWDLSGVPDWQTGLRAHITDLSAKLRAHPVMKSTPLIAPPLARQSSAAVLGDLSGLVDYGNGHPYPGGTQAELAEYSWQTNITLLKGIEAIRLVSGPKPIIMTETGYHNASGDTSENRPVDEATAAIYTPRILLEYFRLGIPRTFLYELVNEKPNAALNDREQHFGLFRRDWTPKPVATAVRNLLRQLDDGRRAPRYASLSPVVDTAQDATLRVMVFARAGGGFTIALWRVQSVWDAEKKVPRPIVDVPTRVGFGQTFRAARVYRPTRGAGAVAEQANTDAMTVPLGPEPTLVTLEPTAQQASASRLREWWCRKTKSCTPS